MKVILINLGQELYTINTGDKVAQMILARHYGPEEKIIKGLTPFKVVDSLETTERGEGGFGSTGK